MSGRSWTVGLEREHRMIPTFIKGDYGWVMKKRPIWRKMRWAVFVFKNDKIIGHVVYHPAAKQLVFRPEMSLTAPTMKYVSQFLDQEEFHRYAQIYASIKRANNGE